MWKSLASLGLAAFLGNHGIAAESPAPPPAQPYAAKPFVAKPGEGEFADPFFAPPGGIPVMDPAKPGSGAAPSDYLFPQPAEFRAERLWLAADFYHALGQGTLLPTLVSAAPNGTPVGTAGALGQPTTSTLFGGTRELNRFRPGVRVNTGIWLTDDHRFGVDASGFFVSNASNSYTGSTTSAGPILAIPVTFGQTGTQFGLPIGAGGTGSISASATSAILGGDANFRYGLTTSERGRLDLLVGYRYVRLGDKVELATRSTPLIPAGVNAIFAVPDTGTSDSFRTLNQFHGGQIGLGGTHRLFDRLTLTTKGTVALGVNISDVTISGNTYSGGGVSSTGLLTGASNIGNNRERYFAVIPEGSFKLGWDFTDRVRLNAGYSILYWNQVRRAADQIDTTIQSPGRPGFPDRKTDYWMQGWTVGLDLRW